MHNGLFNGLFDFNNDGKTDCIEEMLGMAIIEEEEKKKKDEDPDDNDE